MEYSARARDAWDAAPIVYIPFGGGMIAIRKEEQDVVYRMLNSSALRGMYRVSYASEGEILVHERED